LEKGDKKGSNWADGRVLAKQVASLGLYSLELGPLT